MFRTLVAGTGVIALAGGIATGAPVELSFMQIGGATAGTRAQFSCVMNEVSQTVVSFRFTNETPDRRSIGDVYFQDGEYFGSAQLVQQGTLFNAAPTGNLPGGSTMNPAFLATQAFSADYSSSPVAGIDFGSDFLEVRFDLINSMTFADVVAAIATGQLRVGMYVRDPGGAGTAFVNADGTVPLPPAAWAGLSGLAAVGLLALIRRRHSA